MSIKEDSNWFIKVLLLKTLNQLKKFKIDSEANLFV